MGISTTALAALNDRKNWTTVIRVWEDQHPGWHEWPWCKERLGEVIAERKRMIEAGELTPRPPRAPRSTEDS